MSDADSTDTFDLRKLNTIGKALTANNFYVKVGVLSGKNARTDGGPSNATIGAAHEYGTSTIPRRSFLRMPLSIEMPKELEKLGVVTEKDITEILAKTTVEEFAKKIGTLAVATVLRAFDTEGFGTWLSLNEKYKKWKVEYSKKGNTSAIQILTLTGQLRDSITSKVVKKK